VKVVFAHAARFLVLTAVVLGVAAFSDWPRYRAVPKGIGYLTLSFSHGADRRAACRKLSPEEIAELPPNMRRKEICPRERPSIHVELEVNDETFFEAEVPPSGIAGDGPSRVFKRFELPEGRYEIEVHMRDRPGRDAFDYSAERDLHIEAAANRVIDFRPEAGGFVFY
jgi:hypothetical protein